MLYMQGVSFLLLLLLFSCSTSLHIGFRVWNATYGNVNGIYACSSDSRCNLLENPTVHQRLHFLLTSTNAFVNGTVQKRWFISELHEEGKSVSINVYGAIELAADPILQLKAWKRLGSNGAFEPDMHLEPIQFSKPVLNALNNSSMQLVLEEAYILLVAYQCVQLDRTSERGRYILSTLQDYQHTFSAYSTERYAYNPTNLNIDLLQMFLCDYMAAFGAGSEATNCYHTVIERLQQSLPPNYATLHTPVLLQKSNHHHTALHCAYKEQLSEYDHINCHIHYASLRHARHLLIHSVDPVRVLAVLQGKGDVAVAAQSQQSDVWQVMSYCLIGLCTDEHVVVDKAGMKDGAWIRIKNELDHKLLSTPVAAICRECDAILAYLHANGDNEVIHTLFTKICFPFQQLQDRYATAGTPTTGSENHLPWAGKRELMDQSRTVVASLLSIGAVELAALHCANLLHYALDIPQISAGDAESFATTGFSEAILKAELQRMVVLYPGLKLVLPLSTPHSPVDAPLRSPNVGAALSLSLLLRRISESDTLWQDFLSNSDFLSNILNVMFHSTSPVILSTPTRAFTPAAATTSADTLSSAASAGDCSDETVPASWLQEAVLLRHVMVHTLRTVVNACRCGHHQRDSDSDSDSIDGGAKCEITDPASSVGARGLFLLAYQGLGLAAESIETMAHSVESIMTITDTAQEEVKEALGELKYMLRDSTVPSLYQDLLRRASSELASIPPFQRASHFPLTFEEPTCEIGSADQTCTVAVRAEEQQQEPPKRRRIKVAFLSFFFRRHPVGRLLAKIIVKLNHTMFDVHIVTTQENKKQDDVSAYLHRHISPDKWIYITHNMATASNLIRQQQFDVLVFGDVFMDANMAHFATLRLAPVQVCFWGHPFTTGYEHMDYFITSDAFEQKQAQFKHHQYSEQLVRFDFLSFQLLEPETESESDPESYLVMKGSIGSGSSSDDGGSSGDAGGATAAMAPPPRWPPLPPYTLRGLRSEWDCDVSTQNMNAAPGTGTDGIDAATEPRDNITPGSAVDEDFLRRRRQVLRWVTSVGFDIHNMPINEANLIETLRAAHPPPDKESFSPSSSSPSSSSSLSAVVSSVRLYGALQSLFKMHPLFDLAIAEILCRDASAIVLLSRHGRQRHWEQTFRVRLASTLRSYNKHSGEGFCNKTHHAASCGGSCAGSSSKVSEDSLLSRVLFVNQMQHAQYQTLLCSLDVTLDTFPFGGGVTLSDALGGCGLNALSAVFQNDLRDIYHYVVPFVTSGQLQSVHQIGAGMVDKLGANMSDFVHSTPTTLVPYENPSAPLNACLHNDTAVSCVGSTLTSQLQYMHLTHICEYATAAVILASQAQVRKMTVNDTKSRRNDVSLRLADISARTRINDILYDSGDAVKEWNVFLQNIVESDV